MKFSALKPVIKSLENKTVQHAPELLTGFGVALAIGAVIDVIYETPKAMKLLEEKKKKLSKPLTKTETIKTVWKCYIPVVAMLGGSVVCQIESNVVSAKKSAALAAACSLTETAFTEYKDKVAETIGSEEEHEIKEQVIKDKIDSLPEDAEIPYAKGGHVLCYENFTGRLFYSDKETIQSIVNELNRRIITEGYVSLNDFFYEIGLPNVDLGEELGWGEYMTVRYFAGLTEKGIPYLAVDADIGPYIGYADFG